MVIKKPNEHMWLFCFVLILLGIAGPMASDMYAPAMPAQAKAFMTSTHAIELSLSLYMVVAFFGLLFYGALSDCFGRKRMLAIGLSLGIVGSLVCWVAPGIPTFYLGRVIQGLGFSAAPGILPAMSRDVFEGKRLAQAASIISVAFGFSPLIAPVIGGYISMHFGWRMIFLGLALYVTASMLAMLFLPETHPSNKRRSFHVAPMVQTYATIIKDAHFLKNMFSKAIAYTCFIVFYTVTPFMLEKQLHLTAVQYGWITLAITGTILLAKSLNSLLLNKVGLDQLIFLSNCCLFAASVLMLFFACLGWYSLATILIPFALMGMGCGFLFSNASTAAFKSFNGLSSGSVAGLLNGMQRLFAYAGSAIAAHLVITNLMPLALLMTLFTGFSLVQYIYLGKVKVPRKVFV